ncbi:type II toxin-antitoxin system VapC family toxin [Haloarcula nitratireducens]|uniref:Ribonuclease VapC n=1 Tax=Haloarcula nitratireducens TaxID=2487749 RepID=A0AAW4PEL8_9EURY|nr:type II toxin-antitoxin system VapC family toxin [Halomicroarcula nitratireducens]MBX0296385.1 type II toxin-antitoxin system VapC family toxin [Halomicroarcula nitratireducens]
MLLDTSFLIDLMNGDEGAVETARELENELVQQRLSAMTLFELYYGIARVTDSEAEREKVENVLASKPVHPADTAVMRKAGRLSGELQNDGTPVGDGDVIIGATADIVEEPVLTRNAEDFDRLGVETETY